MTIAPTETPVLPSSEGTRRIRKAIRLADEQLTERHPWLGRDNAVAFGLFAGAVLAIGLIAVAWFQGVLPTVLAVLGIALAISVLHELEHDLIHDLYLPQPVLRFGVLVTIWWAKASLDPWSRGRLHLWHHVVSGQEEDLEERLIGMGMPWGLRRALITLLPAAGIVVLPGLLRALRARRKEGRRIPNLRGPGWHVDLVNAVLILLPFVGVGGLIAGQAWAWPLLVLWVLPNLVRHAAIVFMSANSHYVGIRRGMVMEQNQILDHPVFWPLQFLCWNFGATHVVHHFFVQQPFWRRTLVFGDVRPVMVDNGVPANEFGSFLRANQRPQPVISEAG